MIRVIEGVIFLYVKVAFLILLVLRSSILKFSPYVCSVNTKALHAKAPPYISGLLKAKPVGRYNLRSDGHDMLVVPKTMLKTLGDRAFAKEGPSLWNELPVDIRKASSVETFKSQLKTFLFKKAFRV